MRQPTTARLVLICGLPASGKSTLARQLAPEIPAIRLDKDEWVTRLGAEVWDDGFASGWSGSCGLSPRNSSAGSRA